MTRGAFAIALVTLLFASGVRATRADGADGAEGAGPPVHPELSPHSAIVATIESRPISRLDLALGRAIEWLVRGDRERAYRLLQLAVEDSTFVPLDGSRLREQASVLMLLLSGQDGGSPGSSETRLDATSRELGDVEAAWRRWFETWEEGERLGWISTSLTGSGVDSSRHARGVALRAAGAALDARHLDESDRLYRVAEADLNAETADLRRLEALDDPLLLWRELASRDPRCSTLDRAAVDSSLAASLDSLARRPSEATPHPPQFSMLQRGRTSAIEILNEERQAEASSRRIFSLAMEAARTATEDRLRFERERAARLEYLRRRASDLALLEARRVELRAAIDSLSSAVDHTREGAHGRFELVRQQLLVRARSLGVAWDALRHSGAGLLRIDVEGPGRYDPMRSPDSLWCGALNGEIALSAAATNDLTRLAERAETMTDELWWRTLEARIEALRAALRGEDAEVANAALRLETRRAEWNDADAWQTLVARETSARDRVHAISAGHQALCHRLAASVIERTEARLLAEREGVAYGLTAVAYEQAVSGAALIAPARQRIAEFLEAWPTSRARGELRFRLADLTLLEAKQDFRDRMAAFLAAEPVRRGAPPVIETTLAAELYRSILAEDPAFPHRDAVLFQLGMIETDEGNPEGVPRLSELLRRYPNSSQAQAAWLRLGDVDFDNKRFAESIPSYQAVARGPDASLAAIARYKLGWALFQEDRFAEAARAFAGILSLEDETLARVTRRELKQEAEVCLVRSLARAGGVQVFTDIFPARDLAGDEVLRQLGLLYSDHALHAEALEVEALRLQRAPEGASALDAARRQVEIAAQANRGERLSMLRRDFAARFGPRSRWAPSTQIDSLRAEGSKFARDCLEALALERHRTARSAVTGSESARAGNASGEWAPVLSDYDALLQDWPTDRAAPRWRFLAGEAAAQCGRFDDARNFYREAARADTASFALEAAWQVVAVSDAAYESNQGSVSADTPTRSARAETLLEEAQHYREGHRGDPREADLLMREAEVAEREGNQARAAEAIELFTARHDDDSRVGLAYLQLARIETAREHLEAAARALEAASTRVERGDEALYEAAAAFESAKQDDDAARVLDRLRTEHPRSALVSESLLRTGEMERRRGRPLAAGAAYASFAKAYPNDADAAGALLGAADLFAEGGQVARADSLRLVYIDANPGDIRTASTVLADQARRALHELPEEARFTPLLDSEHPIARYLRWTARHADAAAPDLLAEIAFQKAEDQRPGYESCRLTLPLRKSVAQRKDELERLLAAYRRVIDFGVAPWSEAAAYRMGEALVGFCVALETSERPADLNGPDRRAYDGEVQRQAWSFSDRGEEVWSELLRASRESGDGGGWLQRTRAVLWPRIAARFLHCPEVAFPVIDASPSATARIER